MIHFLFVRTLAVVCVLGLACVARGQAVSPYKSPELTSNIFGGDITLPEADRQAVATQLALLTRNTLKYDDKGDYAKASRLLGVALRLDPKNRAAIVVNANLEQGAPPEAEKGFNRNDAIKEIRAAAKASVDTKKKPDQTLGAYLYGAINTVARNDDDTFEIEMLKRDGIVLDWGFAEGKAAKAPADTRPAPAGKAKLQDKIQGMVVLGRDEGRMFGKIVEIIATKPPTAVRPNTLRQIRVLGNVGEQMRISLEEASRVVRQRNEKAFNDLHVEISFGDKYSAKDGGSAGCAYTLLLLSMMGEIDLATDFAITGDVTIDGKVRPVGGVYAKIAGAAKDGAKVVVIPTVNASALPDAYLLEGPSALWTAQVFGVETVDDAIKIVQPKRDEKTIEAMKLFDELRTAVGKKPVFTLNQPEFKEKLAKIRELAPTHLSAQYLQLFASGKGPKTLTLNASISEAMAAIGPMRNGLSGFADPAFGSRQNLDNARRELTKIDAVVDPACKPFTKALADYCVAYNQWNAIEAGEDIGAKFRAREAMRGRIGAVQSALEKITSDKDSMARLLRGE